MIFLCVQISVVVIFVFVSLKHDGRTNFHTLIGIAHIFKTILNSSKFGIGPRADGTNVLGVALGHVTMVTWPV